MKYLEFFKMLEADKSRFINKLDTAEENKQLATDFFKKHPNYENEINWQSPDLSWEDIEEVMHKERISSTQLKKFVKKDKHFLVLYRDENCVLYQPLTWLGSRYLASKDVKPKVEGKWCISYQKERDYWDDYSFEDKKSFIILCTSTTKYALEISPRGTFTPWDAEDDDLNQHEFYNIVSKEVPDIKSLLQKYIPIAINNHSLVKRLYEKDLEECAYIEKVKEEEKEHRIKIFPKSFKRQVRKKGYYNWDGDITYQDLKDLGLVDEGNKVDERFKYFKISGNLDFIRSPITSIPIPDSVTSIGKEAFTGCSSLTEITIPDSVTSIGVDAFYGCSSLTEITLPNSVTFIGESAFCDCSSLTEMTIPNSVTEISLSAFDGCSSLTEITIPDSVTSIKVETFNGCSSLESISIPDSVTSIGEGAFCDCSSLTEITIPNSVTSIGSNAFRGCSSLKEITIPDSVTFIGGGVFNGCSSLKLVTIGNSVTSIGDYVFLGCSSLKNVYIDKEKDSLDLHKVCISNFAKIYWRGEF